MDFLLDTVIVCATLGSLPPIPHVVAHFVPILAAKEPSMLAPMACLVIVPPIRPRFPVLSRILNHRIGCPRPHGPPAWRVTARARALQHTRRLVSGAHSRGHPEGAKRCQGGRK